MTTLEIQANAASPVRMPALITDAPICGVQQSRVVIDCPAYAWDESDKQALVDLRDTFGDDLVDTYESDLRNAAHVLIEHHLDAAWGNRDFVVAYVRNKSAFEDGATPGPDGTPYFVPTDAIYGQVWQAAADAITDKDLITEANLGHVFQMSTDLERHRAALLDRIDDWANTCDDMSERAEQQIEGWRAAVENAVTRAWLIEISALIP